MKIYLFPQIICNNLYSFPQKTSICLFYFSASFFINLYLQMCFVTIFTVYFHSLYFVYVLMPLHHIFTYALPILFASLFSLISCYLLQKMDTKQIKTLSWSGLHAVGGFQFALFSLIFLDGNWYQYLEIHHRFVWWSPCTDL
jgi:hypothetical protein